MKLLAVTWTQKKISNMLHRPISHRVIIMKSLSRLYKALNVLFWRIVDNLLALFCVKCNFLVQFFTHSAHDLFFYDCVKKNPLFFSQKLCVWSETFFLSIFSTFFSFVKFHKIFYTFFLFYFHFYFFYLFRLFKE